MIKIMEFPQENKKNNFSPTLAIKEVIAPWKKESKRT